MRSEGTGSTGFKPAHRFWVWAVLGLSLVIGSYLRFVAVQGQTLWHDEFYTLGNLVGFDVYLFAGADLLEEERLQSASVWASRLQEDLFWQNLWRNLVHEGHPPIYLFALKAWTSLFGSEPEMVRYFSLFCSVLTIPAVFVVGRALANRTAGLFAALLFSVLPFHVYYSAEGRSYALLMLCASIATAAAIRLASGAQCRTTRIVWVVGVAATGLTHYFGTLYCILLAGSMAGLGAFRLASGHGLRHWVWLFSPFVLNALWVPVWLAQMGAHGDSHWTSGAYNFGESLVFGATGLLDYLSGVQASAPASERYFTGLCALVAVLGLSTVTAVRKVYVKRLLLVIAMHIVVVAIADQVLDHHLSAVPRYSACLAVLVPTLVAAGLANVGGSGAVLLILFCAIGFRSSSLTAEGLRAPKQDLARAAHYIERHAAPEDVVIVSPSGPTLVGMGFYLPGHFRIGAVPADRMDEYIKNSRQSGGGKIWHVQQRLGLSIEYDAKAGPTALATTRFVGVDVALY